MNKKCMKCGKPATHKFVRIEGEDIYDAYYCQECASAASPYQKPKLKIGELIATLLGSEQAQALRAGGEGAAKCRSCGLPLAAYRKSLFLGCPDCYDSFGDALVPDLFKFHQGVQHVGRKPGGGRQEPEEHPFAAARAGDSEDEEALAPEDEEFGGEMEEADEDEEDDAEDSADFEDDASLDDEEALEEPPTFFAPQAPPPTTLAGQIEATERLMRDAIAAEDFDTAARCRDRLRELRERLAE